MINEFKVEVEGRVVINDLTNNVVLLDQKNAIHNENMSILLASAAANRSVNGGIRYMAFGTGGTTVDSVGNVVFSPPNITGNAQLYNEVYKADVDDTLGAPSGNQMSVYHENGKTHSFIEIRCVLGVNDPPGQPLVNTTPPSNVNDPDFVFDEIGLKTNTDMLVTHVIFTPITKAANVVIETVYTLKITVG